MGRVAVIVLALAATAAFAPTKLSVAADDDTANSPSAPPSSIAGSPNPYIRGCLQARVPGWEDRWRVCNSYDPPELRGVICQEAPFNDEYLEIRVASGNWASATALAWLAQIVLSELLGVPSTEEPGDFGAGRNFYDLNAALNNGPSVPGSAVSVPSNGTIFSEHGGDCAALKNTKADYTPCAHAHMELWGGFRQTTQDFVRQRLIEPPQSLGVLAQESWFVTAFTAKVEPSVVSWYGMSGDQHRQKLAELFRRPVTWKEYCEEVSKKNCSTPDETARRYPEEDESAKMFSDGFYTGHFRYTDANNCTKWPENCTGKASMLALSIVPVRFLR